MKIAAMAAGAVGSYFGGRTIAFLEELDRLGWVKSRNVRIDLRCVSSCSEHAGVDKRACALVSVLRGPSMLLCGFDRDRTRRIVDELIRRASYNYC